jgi:hypothetical protein
MAIDRIEYSQQGNNRDFSMDDDTYTLIGSFRRIKCFAYEGKLTKTIVFVLPKNSVAGYSVCEIELSQININRYEKSVAWRVTHVKVDQRFQGYGLVPSFYKFIMKKLGIILEAGTCQSPGGRYIWAQLSKVKDVTVFAKSVNSKAYSVECDDSDRELVIDGPYQLYDGLSKIRLFAAIA